MRQYTLRFAHIPGQFIHLAFDLDHAILAANGQPVEKVQFGVHLRQRILGGLAGGDVEENIDGADQTSFGIVDRIGVGQDDALDSAGPFNADLIPVEALVLAERVYDPG